MAEAKVADDTLSVEDEPDSPGHGDSPVLSVVFRCDNLLARPRRCQLAGIDDVLFGRGDKEPQVEAGRLHLYFPDPRMSLSHARLHTVDGEFVFEDLQSKNGSRINGVRVDEVPLRDGDLIELGGTYLIFRNLDSADIRDPVSLLGVETLVPRFAHELGAARDIARSNVPLLLLGETGTGKEVVARAAHAESGRRGPLVPVNCAALPDALVESELFGSKKGAFSGADADRGGLIAAAHKGTLFLDEIGELSLPAQAALLRVLQDGEVTPLGTTKSVPCDVRVISATNRDLSAAVDSGRFRADLYARLSGFKLRLWPLRERKEDLGLLITALVRRLAPDRAAKMSFSLAAARSLLQHNWPLNIRELQQALSVALVLATDRVDRAQLQLASEPRRPPGAKAAASPDEGSTAAKLSPEHQARRRQLSDLLARHDGNISAVARELGKQRVQIRRWIQMYRLPTKR